MESKKIKIKKKKTIALVAHDHKKKELLEWVKSYENKLKNHNLIGTGTTATLITNNTSLTVEKLASGPLGGDQQLGALISKSKIDILIFFWDPLEALPHDPDVKALLRISTLYDVAMATSKITADYLITSSLFDEAYNVYVPNSDDNVEKRIYENKFE